MVTETSSYEFTADTARIDPARVHGLLAEYAYWAAGRPRELQDRAIANSRNYGILAASGELIGYARVVTDLANFAWLADVIVDPHHRRRGLARELIRFVLADLRPYDLRRIVLKASPEGRGLYEELGWKRLDDPDDWLGLGPDA
ncbi:GNAT family N-acetyltransferase [Myceligenerans crystallogenes]|uniref:GNAT family N-acetyltransferase n=1 Tax=Myceligenerans crystallogenes TaxID=316335 RepID=A0ABN2NJB0_9MICO